MLKIKKGQSGFEEVLYVVATLFAIAIFLFILYFAYGQIKTPVSEGLTNALPSGETSFNVTETLDDTESTITLFSSMYPFFLFGLILFVIISAFFINSHPIFFFVSIVILFVVILLGAVFSNVYQRISTDDNFGDTSSHLTVMHILMKYLPWIAAVIVGILMFILFSKPKGTGGI